MLKLLGLSTCSMDILILSNINPDTVFEMWKYYRVKEFNITHLQATNDYSACDVYNSVVRPKFVEFMTKKESCKLSLLANSRLKTSYECRRTGCSDMVLISYGHITDDQSQIILPYFNGTGFYGEMVAIVISDQ